MQKLIKLSDTHYVVVDDSEIKEGDISVMKDGGKYKINPYPINNERNLRITCSTQPELLGTGWIQSVLPLLLSEVEEVIYGCWKTIKTSLSKEVIDLLNTGNITYFEDRTEYELPFKFIKRGEDWFISHKELVKDKLFIDKKDLQPLQDLLDEGYDPYDTYHHLQVQRILRIVESFVESLLPKTEWNCKVVNGKIKLI